MLSHGRDEARGVRTGPNSSMPPYPLPPAHSNTRARGGSEFGENDGPLKVGPGRYGVPYCLPQSPFRAERCPRHGLVFFRAFLKMTTV